MTALTANQIDRLWRDAYCIAFVGASNVRGVQYTISEHLSAGVPADHPAIAAMQGHIDFLDGVSLGPPIEILDMVVAHHNEMKENA